LIIHDLQITAISSLKPSSWILNWIFMIQSLEEASDSSASSSELDAACIANEDKDAEMMPKDEAGVCFSWMHGTND
jgi:hypothetical protein